MKNYIFIMAFMLIGVVGYSTPPEPDPVESVELHVFDTLEMLSALVMDCSICSHESDFVAIESFVSKSKTKKEVLSHPWQVGKSYLLENYKGRISKSKDPYTRQNLPHYSHSWLS